VPVSLVPVSVSVSVFIRPNSVESKRGGTIVTDSDSRVDQTSNTYTLLLRFRADIELV
jgi:hypothetical protein